MRGGAADAEQIPEGDAARKAAGIFHDEEFGRLQDEDFALAAIIAVGDGVVDGLAHHFFVVEREIEKVKSVGNIDFVVPQVDVMP